LTAIGAVVGWKLATALNGTTGVGEGLAPAPDEEAVAFDTGVEAATALDDAAFRAAIALNGPGVGVVVGIS
jgi:hypothetical protein